MVVIHKNGYLALKYSLMFNLVSPLFLQRGNVQGTRLRLLPFVLRAVTGAVHNLWVPTRDIPAILNPRLVGIVKPVHQPITPVLIFTFSHLVSTPFRFNRLLVVILHAITMPRNKAVSLYTVRFLGVLFGEVIRCNVAGKNGNLWVLSQIGVIDQ